MNQKPKKFLLVISIIILIVIAWFIVRFVIGGPEDDWICQNNQWIKHGNPKAPMPTIGCQTTQQTTPPQNTPQTIPETILIDVPFISQAPFGQWSEPTYQNACEEASILMAHLWIDNIKSISKEEATKEIKDMADFEDRTFGTNVDLSTPDTAKLMEEYYNYANIEVKTNIIADDIIRELKNGNLVIVPANGQKLNNPFYTPPGPTEHKLLIKGYDFKTNEFITNDCGTRHGENYRYPKQVLYDAIREYPTGNKEPITSVQKIMIIIKKAP